MTLALGLSPTLGVRSQLQRAISLLRRLGSNAHVYLPGIGSLNGLQVGNYLDSAGTTLATVDNPVGLVLDGMGSLGVDLCTATTIATSQTIVIDPTSLPGYHFLVLNAPAGLSWHDGTGVYTLGGLASQYIAIKPGGSGLNIYQATGSPIDITNVEIRKVTGIHATQATTGSKPRLERGLRNLLTYSGDFSNAAWNAATYGCSATSNRITPLATAGIHRVLHAFPAGLANGSVYTGSVKLKADGIRYVYINMQAVSNTQIAVDLQLGVSTSGTCELQPDGHYMVTWTGSVVNSAGAGTWLQANNSYVAGDVSWTPNGTDSFYAKEAAIFAGTYTAAQIQALGGIPLTTSAAASNPTAGPYSWYFDGGDSLALGSVPFQMSDDHAVIVGASAAATGYRAIVDVAGGGGHAGAIWFTNTNIPYASWRNDAAVEQAVMGSTVSLGSTFIASCKSVSGVGYFRQNGVLKGSASLPTGAATISAGRLGAQANGVTFFTGNIGPIIAIKGTLTDAELLLLEKLVANLSGIQL